MNPIRCERWASLLGKGEACGESREPATALSMSLDWMRGVVGMVGASTSRRDHVDDESAAGNRREFMTKGSEEPARRSQNAHSSGEAGNDRGAKGA